MANDQDPVPVVIVGGEPPPKGEPSEGKEPSEKTTEPVDPRIQAQKEYLELKRKEYKYSEDQLSLASESLKGFQERMVAAERIANSEERIKEITKIQLEMEADLVEKQQNRQRLLRDIADKEAEIKSLTGSGSGNKEKIAQLEQEVRLLKQIERENENAFKQVTATADLYKTGLKEGFNEFYKALGAPIPFLDKLQDTQRLKGFIEGFSKELESSAGKAMLVGKALESVGSLSQIAMNGFKIPLLDIQVKGLTDTFKEFDQAKADAFKAFGPQDKFEDSMESIRAEMLKTAGVSEKELRTAYGNLNKAGVAATAENAKFTAEMQKLGIESDKTSKIMKTLETSLQAVNKGTVDAKRTLDDMRKLGQAMGVGGAALITSMDSLMPKIVGFGEKGPEAFKKTSIAAQALGVEASKLFEVMSQYDTFDKAATAAGEFNLALGGQFIDPLKLMEASVEKGPYETLKVLQKGFQDSGKSIDQMSPKFLKFAADAAKMDVETFTKLFKGDPASLEAQIQKMEEQAKQQKNLEESAKETQTTFQQLQNIIASAFANKDVMDSIKGMVDGIGKMVPLPKYRAKGGG